MKVRFPLYAQILSFLLLHLILLVALFVLFFNNQFGLGWEAIINSPAGERMEAIVWIVHQQIDVSPPSAWTGILTELGKFYGVKFYLFDHNGHELAGDPIVLPQSVVERTKVLTSRPPVRLAAVPTDINLSNPFTSVLPRISAHRRFLMHTSDPDVFWIGTRIRIEPGREAAVLLTAAPHLWNTRLFNDFWLFIGSIAGILFLSVIIWWPFVYGITSALTKLTKATEKIAEGSFDTHLTVDRLDELGSLTEAINSMSGRLNTFVTGQKRFLGDIAHELCSPLARLRMALELLEGSITHEQESITKDIHEEVDEMTTLINELLAFSKAGLRRKDLPLIPVVLEPLLKSTIEKINDKSSIVLKIPRGLCVLGDQLLLERALANILRNSIRYAGSEGPIEIKAVISGSDVVITVTDSGPGVPVDELKRLGQPFYRIEPSRNRNSGGTGLGLAIVKSCIESCNGTLKLRNHEPKGLQVEICLKNGGCPVN